MNLLKNLLKCTQTYGEEKNLAWEKRVLDQRFKINQNNRKCLPSMTLLSDHLTERGLCLLTQNLLRTLQKGLQNSWLILFSATIWAQYPRLWDSLVSNYDLKDHKYREISYLNVTEIKGLRNSVLVITTKMMSCSLLFHSQTWTFKWMSLYTGIQPLRAYNCSSWGQSRVNTRPSLLILSEFITSTSFSSMCEDLQQNEHKIHF